MNQNHKGCGWIYIMPVLYLLSVYLFPVIFLVKSCTATGQADMDSMPSWTLLLPIVFGIINLITVLAAGKKVTRIQLLNCARIVKYGLVPFYIIGGLCIALAILLTFTPVVIMIFVGPAIVITFSVWGWLVLACSAPYSMAYIVRACKERVHGGALSAFAGIFQFFFCMDVIFLIILACKDRRYRRISKNRKY